MNRFQQYIVDQGGYTVSEGTMRNADLIPALVAALEELGIRYRVPKKLDLDSERASEITHELFDILDKHAPPGFYFGAHEGDGAHYGFWRYDIDWEEVDELIDEINKILKPAGKYARICDYDNTR